MERLYVYEIRSVEGRRWRGAGNFARRRVHDGLATRQHRRHDDKLYSPTNSPKQRNRSGVVGNAT
jgi:hypothetical protein